MINFKEENKLFFCLMKSSFEVKNKDFNLTFVNVGFYGLYKENPLYGIEFVIDAKPSEFNVGYKIKKIEKPRYILINFISFTLVVYLCFLHVMII